MMRKTLIFLALAAAPARAELRVPVTMARFDLASIGDERPTMGDAIADRAERRWALPHPVAPGVAEKRTSVRLRGRKVRLRVAF